MASTALVQRFYTEIEIASVWTRLRRIDSLDLPPVTPEMADSSSFDNSGYASKETVSLAWSSTIGFWKALDDVNAMYAEQEYLRTTALSPFGGGNRLHFRFYDKNGGPEAYDGWAFTTYKNDGGNWNGLQHVTLTLDGDGPLVSIANPAAGAQVPIALTANVTPTAQTAGNEVVVKGSNMLGTTGLTVGGVAVGTGKFAVIDRNTLVFVMPAGSAGPAPLIITNGAGPSASITYTRGA